MNKVALFYLFFLGSFIMQAQEVDSLEQSVINNSNFEPVTDTISVAGSLFEGDEAISITLKYDINAFTKGKYKDGSMPAELIVHLAENDSIIKNIAIKARGNFRKSYCQFPPIKLNFKHDPLKDPDFKGVHKLKMVTPCKDSKTFNEYILKEYLAYELYNAITDESFKVRLLKINFVDTGKKAKKYTYYGFVIEPVELVVKRNNAVELETLAVNYNELDELATDRVALLQYMIANTDWMIKAGHNNKLMKVLDFNRPGAVVLPYDFDYSGFVNTSYAEPQRWSRVSHVTEREYLGFCRSGDTNFELLKKEFLEAENTIQELIMSFELLPLSERKKMSAFIGEFYDTLKSPYAYKIICATCREPY